jgi:glycosyltransferase involved in cell wall biosynthesis
MSVRVLQVIGGSKFGGGVWVVLSYVQALQEHGCSVTVCTSVPSVAEVFRNAGCAIVSVPEMEREINPLRDIRALVRLTRVCGDGHFDVVHTHTSKGGFIGRAAARLARVPVVIHTAHGFAFQETSSARAVAFYATLERLAARWCDRIVTVSEFHRTWAIKLGITSSQKIVTIQNGIALDRLKITRVREDIRRDLGVGNSDVLLVSIGRLFPQKGLRTLLEALPRVIRADERIRVVLAGEGPLRAELEAQTKEAGLGRVVTFLGFRSDVGDLLNASDVVVAPTLFEGLSISVLEAMATAKPIVTTNIGSNLELVEDGVSALLVPPQDPVRLGEAILKVAGEPILAARLGRAGKDRFDAAFTERAMKDSLWSLYQGLLRQKLSPKSRLMALS